MDVTINLNLTPKEARELMGLADLRPLQEEVLAEIRQRVMARVQDVSADGLLKTWFASSSSAFDLVRNTTSSMLSQSAGASTTAKRKASSEG